MRIKAACDDCSSWGDENMRERQTPLCATLWSMAKSFDIEDAIQNVLLVPEEIMSFTIPVVSIIPVNIYQKYFFYHFEF